MDSKKKDSIMSVIGKRVRIVGDHPHFGETGVVERIENTIAGPGLLIKLYDCTHGVERCFVYKRQDIKVIG